MDKVIALFDMDNTLANYTDQLVNDLEKIASPGEPKNRSCNTI